MVKTCWCFAARLEFCDSCEGGAESRISRMIPSMPDSIPAAWCKPGVATHGSAVLQPCLQPSLLVLAHMATVPAPEDTGDVSHNIGGRSVLSEWAHFPLSSSGLMKLLFHRDSGSVFARASGKKGGKILLFPYFFFYFYNIQCRKALLLCLVGWMRGEMRGASGKSHSLF